MRSLLSDVYWEALGIYPPSFKATHVNFWKEDTMPVCMPLGEYLPKTLEDFFSDLMIEILEEGSGEIWLSEGRLF